MKLPSSCPPSMCSLASSASARVSNSTYAKPRDKLTWQQTKTQPGNLSINFTRCERGADGVQHV